MRPFLKWAGSKRQLLPELRRFYPPVFGAYHEVFLGSGAVFFDLASSGRLAGREVRLADINADLIGCWQRLRDQPEAVIERLGTLASDYKVAPKEHYYRIRDDLFNPARMAIMQGGHIPPDGYSAELAAMLIYLNRTCFNGLFRLNSQGIFNVPQGSQGNPRICDAENLTRVAAALDGPGVKLVHASYGTIMDVAERGDFLYFDPPYAPLSQTARFTGYTAEGFDATDQRELQEVVVELARRQCHVLLSNSTATEIAELYDGDATVERVGIQAHRVPARRAINSDGGQRGPVLEYIITNIPRNQKNVPTF